MEWQPVCQWKLQALTTGDSPVIREHLVIDVPGLIAWEFRGPGGRSTQVEFALRYDGEVIGFVTSDDPFPNNAVSPEPIRGELIAKLQELAEIRIKRPQLKGTSNRRAG